MMKNITSFPPAIQVAMLEYPPASMFVANDVPDVPLYLFQYAEHKVTKELIGFLFSTFDPRTELDECYANPTVTVTLEELKTQGTFYPNHEEFNRA